MYLEKEDIFQLNAPTGPFPVNALNAMEVMHDSAIFRINLERFILICLCINIA